MSNTRRATPKKLKWTSLENEALKQREKMGEPVHAPPFVIEVGGGRPDIEITEPDTFERQAIIADFVGGWERGEWTTSAVMPLLRALTGDQFPRVWPMLKDQKDAALAVTLINAMFEHFKESAVIENAKAAAELPGGSEGS